MKENETNDKTLIIHVVKDRFGNCTGKTYKYRLNTGTAESELKQLITEVAEKAKHGTLEIREPIDYIGLGKNTKGLPLRDALQKALSEVNTKDEDDP